VAPLVSSFPGVVVAKGSVTYCGPCIRLHPPFPSISFRSPPLSLAPGYRGNKPQPSRKSGIWAFRIGVRPNPTLRPTPNTYPSASRHSTSQTEPLKWGHPTAPHAATPLPVLLAASCARNWCTVVTAACFYAVRRILPHPDFSRGRQLSPCRRSFPTGLRFCLSLPLATSFPALVLQ